MLANRPAPKKRGIRPDASVTTTFDALCASTGPSKLPQLQRISAKSVPIKNFELNSRAQALIIISQILGGSGPCGGGSTWPSAKQHEVITTAATTDDHGHLFPNPFSSNAYATPR